MRVVRIFAGILLLGLILGVAGWAVRDCPVAPYVYENCIWLTVRDRYHLTQSKFSRAVVLEGIGLALLAGIIFDFRYVFPRGRKGSSRSGDADPSVDLGAPPSRAK